MRYLRLAHYPTLETKAAALGYSLISSHPFLDGNKRVGHAAIEAFLMINGYELVAAVDDAERTILGVAAGTVTRNDLIDWLREHVHPLEASGGCTRP